MQAAHPSCMACGPRSPPNETPRAACLPSPQTILINHATHTFSTHDPQSISPATQTSLMRAPLRGLLFHTRQHQTSSPTLPSSWAMQATHASCMNLGPLPTRLLGLPISPSPQTVSSVLRAWPSKPLLHVDLRGIDTPPSPNCPALLATLDCRARLFRSNSVSIPPHTPFLISFANSAGFRDYNKYTLIYIYIYYIHTTHTHTYLLIYLFIHLLICLYEV